MVSGLRDGLVGIDSLLITPWHVVKDEQCVTFKYTLADTTAGMSAYIFPTCLHCNDCLVYFGKPPSGTFVLIFSGQLAVYIEDNESGNSTRVFLRGQDHGEVWHLGQVSLTSPNMTGRSVRLLFRVRSQALGSEVALDDVLLHTTPCDFDCKF